MNEKLAKTTESIGYHFGNIQKGEYGEYSKIEEEFLEFRDARDQNAKLMELMELSDLYGAIEAYLDNHHPSVLMSDIATMSNITKRAFTNGHR